MDHLLSLKAGVTLNPRIQATFYGLCMTLKRSFTPTHSASIVRDFDKEPARRYSEVFDFGDFSHNRRICSLQTPATAF
jgi:hypothetical protein